SVIASRQVLGPASPIPASDVDGNPAGIRATHSMLDVSPTRWLALGILRLGEDDTRSEAATCGFRVRLVRVAARVGSTLLQACNPDWRLGPGIVRSLTFGCTALGSRNARLQVTTPPDMTPVGPARGGLGRVHRKRSGRRRLARAGGRVLRTARK